MSTAVTPIRRFGVILLAIPILLLGIAGGSKVVNGYDFRLSLQSWKLIPPIYYNLITIAVPLAELSIVGLWLGCGLRRRAWQLAIALLSLYSVAFALHLATDSLPKCQCISLIDAYFAHRDASAYALLRNGAMVICILLGAWLTGDIGGARRSPLSPNARSEVVETRSRGFTLVEVLVCLGIVGLLISLVIPALGKAKLASQRAGSLSNLRQHGAVFAMYNADWSERFPFFAMPDNSLTLIRCEIYPLVIEMKYYHSSHESWNYALADRYYDGNYNSRVFHPPGYPAGLDGVGGLGGPTSYLYSCTFIARPEFWNPSTRSGIEQRRPTRLADVVFPSLKCELFAVYPVELSFHPMIEARPGLPAECQFVDGSASVPTTSFIPGYSSGDGPYYGSEQVHQVDWYWTLHTIDGVRGRDVRNR